MVEIMALNDMDSIVILPALGRPLQLGMMYDCRNDAMIPGFTLWDMEAIGKDQRVTEQNKSEFQILTSDSIETKASALDVPASLKASFLGGLVDVSGAAKFLRHTRPSKTQARVTLQYLATTRFDQLTMTHLKPDNMTYSRIFEQDMGTHVVMGVLYGAQAFCIFDCKVSSSDNMHDTYRELETAVKKIPIVDTDYMAGDNINIAEEASYQKISCTFYSDYGLKKNLSSYSKANEFFKRLPWLPANVGVPLKVWLYPLRKLNARAPQVVRNIRPVIIEEIQAVMEPLSDIDMQCEDLLDQPAAITFPDIKSKIQRFRDLCKEYRLTFENSLSGLIPSIRKGDREESALAAILTVMEKSPFNTQQLAQYIESLGKEVSLVSFYLNYMKVSQAVNIASSQQEINQFLWDPKVEMVVLFTFTSLQDEDPHLSDLQNWLQYKRNTFLPASLCPPCTEKSRKWFENADIKRDTRTYVNEFMEFANSNMSEKIRFVVFSVTDPGNVGVSIYLYEKGMLKNTSFCPPQLDVPVISEISHNSVWLTCGPCPASSDPVLGYRVEYRSKSDQKWVIIDGMDPNRVFSVTGLLPNSLYQFRQSAVLARWVTRPSDPTGMIKTLPCSPPGKVNHFDEQPTSTTLSWEEPDNIGVDTQIAEYKIEYLEEPKQNNAWREVMTGKKTETFIVQGLQPNSSYRFRVSAVCENAGTSSPSEEYVFATSLDSGIHDSLSSFKSHFFNEQNPPERVIRTQMKTSFKMDNGMYWSSTPGGIKGQNKKGKTCMFQVCLLDTGKVEIRDYRGNYLRVPKRHLGHTIQTDAHRDDALSQFEVQYENEKVFFRGSNGLFLSRIYYIDYEHTLEARKETKDVFCLFEVIGTAL